MSFRAFYTLLEKLKALSSTQREQLRSLSMTRWPEAIDSLVTKTQVKEFDGFAECRRNFIEKHDETGRYVRNLPDLRETPKSDLVKMHMSIMKLPPNNYQFSLASIAMCLSKHFPRQIYVVKGGNGKSRIAITTAYLLKSTLPGYTIGKVHLIFSNQVLMEKD